MPSLLLDNSIKDSQKDFAPYVGTSRSIWGRVFFIVLLMLLNIESVTNFNPQLFASSMKIHGEFGVIIIRGAKLLLGRKR